MYTVGERFMHSITHSIKAVIVNLDMPVIVGAVFFAVVIIFLKIKYKNSFKQKVDIKRILAASLSVVYLAFLLYITLLQRIGIEQNPPFSEVWTGWSIFKTNKIYFLDFSPAINLVMMMPMAFVTKYAIKLKNKFVLNTVLISFLSSVIIESCQIIFRLGTFQVSDLVYNTISGFIGAIILYLIEKAYKKRKCD